MQELRHWASVQQPVSLSLDAQSFCTLDQPAAGIGNKPVHSLPQPQAQAMLVRGRLSLQWSVMIVMAVHLYLREASAVKRTMPMIGMDEDGEEIDPDKDIPATQQPRNALQSLISGLLGKVRCCSMTLWRRAQMRCYALCLYGAC